MIIVITSTEKNAKTGRMETLVSHGVDESTGKVVVMSNESPEAIGAVWLDEYHSYVLPDDREQAPSSGSEPVEPAAEVEANLDQMFGF